MTYRTTREAAMKCGHWHVGPVTWTRQRVCENCKQALTIQELADYARMDMRYLEMKTAVLVSTVMTAQPPSEKPFV